MMAPIGGSGSFDTIRERYFEQRLSLAITKSDEIIYFGKYCNKNNLYSAIPRFKFYRLSMKCIFVVRLDA